MFVTFLGLESREWGKSSEPEYQDLKLHELQLSTAQQTSYYYARALVSPAGDQGWRDGGREGGRELLKEW